MVCTYSVNVNKVIYNKQVTEVFYLNVRMQMEKIFVCKSLAISDYKITIIAAIAM